MKGSDDKKELLLPETSQLPALKDQQQNPYLQLGTSENTRRAYRSDIRHFENWGGKLPATSFQIVEYLKFYADKINTRTLERRIVALRHWHTYQNFIDPTSNPIIQKTLKGIRRVHGKPKVRAHPITLQELTQVHHFLTQQESLHAYRDDALFQIGFFGAFRRSELVSLQIEHIEWKKEGICLLLPKSKTDQENLGANIFIPVGNAQLCPVTSLKKWLDMATIKSGSVFRRISKNEIISTEGLTPLSINLLLQNRFSEAGIKTHYRISGHSLRRGLASCAAKAGAPLQTIMRSGRWKQTSTVMEYIEESKSFEENVLNHILKTNR